VTRDVVITCPFSSILWPCATTVTIEEEDGAEDPEARALRTACSTGAQLDPQYAGWDVLLKRTETKRHG